MTQNFDFDMTDYEWPDDGKDWQPCSLCGFRRPTRDINGHAICKQCAIDAGVASDPA